MKRLTLLACLCLMTVFLLSACGTLFAPSETTAENPEGLAFFLKDDGTYAVEIGQAKYLSRIEIPATYRGAAVTEVGSFGATKEEEKNSALKEIVIPDSVTRIGESAFYLCEALESVTIGAGVTEIGKEAFAECESLASVVIPEGVEVIGEGAFSGNSGMTIYAEAEEAPSGWAEDWNHYYDAALGVHLGTPVVWNCRENEVASDGALYAVIDGLRYALRDGKAAVIKQSEKVKTVTVPASVTYRGTVYPVTEIRGSAFFGCRELTSVTLGDAVEVIGHSAFRDCPKLASVTLGAGLTEIQGSAFRGCIALTSLTVPSSVEVIGYAALEGCYLLESLTLPFVGETRNSTENTYLGFLFGAGSRLTQGSLVPYSLKSVTVLGGEVAAYAFRECRGLLTVTLGEEVTAVGMWAFEGCTSLTSVTLGDGIRELAPSTFRDCTALTSVTLPERLVSIDSAAFVGCTALTSLVIPESVETIVAHAFEECHLLTVYAEAAEKPAGWAYLWDAVTCHPELISLPVVFGYVGE